MDLKNKYMCDTHAGRIHPPHDFFVAFVFALGYNVNEVIYYGENR